MIKQDKISHFLVGLLLGWTGGIITYTIFQSYIVLAGLSLSIGAGLFKELYDIKGTGFSWGDLLATSLGGSISTLIVVIIFTFLAI